MEPRAPESAPGAEPARAVPAPTTLSTFLGARHGVHTLPTKLALLLCAVMVFALLTILFGGP